MKKTDFKIDQDIYIYNFYATGSNKVEKYFIGKIGNKLLHLKPCIDCNIQTTIDFNETENVFFSKEDLDLFSLKKDKANKLGSLLRFFDFEKLSFTELGIISEIISNKL